jgi:hypothetical protein
MSYDVKQTARGTTATRPLHFNAPEAELTELRRRINATRWPERQTVQIGRKDRMKSFLLTLATGVVVGHAALAADSTTPRATASNANVNCVPGMTSPTPGICSLPGFHWEYTTASLGTKSYDNSYDRSVWMLLPNK